jgi:BolA family transcriptional regulator, general stress-responsive regulator
MTDEQPHRRLATDGQASTSARARVAHAPSAEAIDAVLRQQFEPAELLVQDESDLHAGHAGAREGGHFRITIASNRFVGLTRVARHRLIYDALAAWIPHGIHALAIDARVNAQD